MKAQAKVCADMSKAAGQKITDISDALQKALGEAAAPPGDCAAGARQVTARAYVFRPGTLRPILALPRRAWRNW